MPTALIPLLIQFGIQYGPEAVNSIIALWNKSTTGAATIEDVQAAFANLKPYSAYNINPPTDSGTQIAPAAVRVT